MNLKKWVETIKLNYHIDFNNDEKEKKYRPMDEIPT